MDATTTPLTSATSKSSSSSTILGGGGTTSFASSQLPLSSSRRPNATIVAVSLLVCVALAAVGITIDASFVAADRNQARVDALDMAQEVGAFFANELQAALLPLFSMAQFATELDGLRTLPQQVMDGAPFLPESTYYRNVSGICDTPALVERYNKIARAIQENAGMDGILHNLQLSPHGVICLLYPLNNTKDFVDIDSNLFLDSSSVYGLDLLHDPFLQYIARSSLQGVEVGIAGPRTLTQCPACGLYFIARLPIVDPTHTIVVDDTLTVPNRWGFATALIHWDRLVDRGNVRERFHQRGMEFQLTRTDRVLVEDDDTAYYRSVDVVLAVSDGFGTAPMRRRTHVQSALQSVTNNEWVMTIEYDSATPYEVVVVGVSLAVAVCIASLVYMVLLQKQRHAAMVAHTSTQNATVSMERNMTAYFAHELRNPLSAMDCALIALQQGGADDTTNASELLQSMTLCCSFMTNIMNNLLDVRKIEEGHMVLREDVMSLRMVLEDVRNMLRPSLRPGVVLHVECAGTTTSDCVMGDSHRIVQVLTNVTSNAAKYTLEGSITLAARWITSTLDTKNGAGVPVVQIECIDTGPGIPKEELQTIFNPFTTRGGAPGTGLGLAIAKRMVELMRGTIRFESDPTLRPGTRCVVELPLRPVVSSHESSATMKCSEEAPPSPKPEKIADDLQILLVDDIKMNRSLLQHRFVKCIAPNCVVQQAATGEEAIQLCERTTFDIIVMDHYMEGAGGVLLGTDTIIALRRAGVNAIIIGCSGNTVDAQFKAAGADGVWKKPLPSNDEIIRQLRSFEHRFPSARRCAL